MRSASPPLGGRALLVLVLCSCSRPSAPEAVEATPTPEAKEPEPPQPPALSEEDLALIAADPKTLSPEDRRKRAYAVRRKIMQNPDSPAARMLQDLHQAHQSGEIGVSKGGGPVFSLPGADGGAALPPAGYRPPPEPAP